MKRSSVWQCAWDWPLIAFFSSHLIKKTDFISDARHFIAQESREFDELRTAALRFLIIQEKLASADFMSNQQRHSLKNAAGCRRRRRWEILGKDATTLAAAPLFAICYAAVERDVTQISNLHMRTPRRLESQWIKRILKFVAGVWKEFRRERLLEFGPPLG